ncbi:sugar phosphate isomerase/epimerase [Paenibacillus sp. HB172176]|uniref:sugar phosphate isomerase/epimerase family protein n=1 Tax=Paenibacillus sp. HB172176 TaxID=2493690 RepID=UPI001438C6AF|nr:sugar phosphate isomerase/epimerase [Paenibacillus sp. HB172176]
MRDKLAVQLFTLRDACQEDFFKVLEELADMGWAGVQLAGYHGHDPEELAGKIRKLGMKTAGMHVSLDRITEETEAVVKEAELFGTRDVICPAVPVELRNEEGYRQVKKALQSVANKTNLRISYHNHAFEFETIVDGQEALSYLLDPSENNPILAEIDVHWIMKAGQDPLSYIDTYRNRMPIIHLKDVSDDEERMTAEIGTGLIDFPPILSWGEESGVEWYVVEQDRCRRNPMDSVRTSFENINRMIAELA